MSQEGDLVEHQLGAYLAGAKDVSQMAEEAEPGDIVPADRLLLADAQTSGGLLLAVPPENERALVEALRSAETPAAAVIGRLTEGPAGSVRVVRRA